MDIQLAKMTDIQAKADKDYVDVELAKKVNSTRVLTDVPANAKFTDTVYNHPDTHPASMVTGLPTVPSNLSQFTNDVGFIDGSYNNSESGLTATTIQVAIDELKALIDGLSEA